MPPARKKLLLLIPNFGMGGAQRVFCEHSRLLADRFDVEEAVFNLDHEHAFPSGNPVHALEVKGGGGLLAKIFNLRRRVLAMRRIKNAVRPAVCISHMPGADYVNLLSKGAERTIAVVHGSKRGDKSQKNLLGLLQTHIMLPLLYRRADAVVTVSRDLAKEISDLGVEESRIRIINNLFHHDQILAKAAEPLPPEYIEIFDGSFVIISVGRLVEQKNQRALLEVFSKLQARRKTKLVIIGDGPLKRELVERARALNLDAWDHRNSGEEKRSKEVYFLGEQAAPFHFLANANMFVLTSSWEGFPLALGEAMICGLPVVSADCLTGPREMVAPETNTPDLPIMGPEEGSAGLLLPVLNPAHCEAEKVETWARELDALIADTSRLERLGRAAALRMESFRADRIGLKWFELIDTIIETGSPPKHQV